MSLRSILTYTPYLRTSSLSNKFKILAKRTMTTKTIAVLDASELKDGQLKEVDFGEGKVLLSKLGDKIHATSAFCTHYGAPLAKGVLTSDGRVTCPWHGACFDVCTGDIEDAPALDAIYSFKTSVSDGKIHVTADPSRTLKDNKSRPPTLLSEGIEEAGKGVIIVGGGSGCIHSIESLRENGYKGAITVLTIEAYPPIDRTKLSKAAPTELKDVLLRSAADLRIKYGANFRTGVTVTSVNAANKTVTINGGKETFGYDKLILAPGGSPRRLPVEGADLSNVFTLRHLEDVQKILGVAKEGKRMVLIGSSFIGMELLTALAKQKLASVDVVGMESVPYETQLGKEIGKGFKESHEKNGIKFHMNAKVSKLLPASGVQTTLVEAAQKVLPSASTPAAPVRAVVIENGPTIECDFVLMAVGVSPATGFLKESGWQLEKDGGVAVDEFLRVKGVEDVYAIGDIAHYPQIQTGEVRRIEHWNVAANHGRAVGHTIAGKQPIPFEKIPIFWSVQGLRYAGLSYKFDEVHINGDTAEQKFVAYYIKGDDVVAVCTMQTDPIMAKCSELMRLGMMPSATEIKNGLDPLTIDVATVESKLKVKSGKIGA